MSEAYIPQGYPMRIAKESPQGRATEYGQWVIGWSIIEHRVYAVLADGQFVSYESIQGGEYVVVVP